MVFDTDDEKPYEFIGFSIIMLKDHMNSGVRSDRPTGTTPAAPPLRGGSRCLQGPCRRCARETLLSSLSEPRLDVYLLFFWALVETLDVSKQNVLKQHGATNRRKIQENLEK